jgi:hypothetical protein
MYNVVVGGQGPAHHPESCLTTHGVACDVASGLNDCCCGSDGVHANVSWVLWHVDQ